MIQLPESHCRAVAPPTTLSGCKEAERLLTAKRLDHSLKNMALRVMRQPLQGAVEWKTRSQMGILLRDTAFVTVLRLAEIAFPTV